MAFFQHTVLLPPFESVGRNKSQSLQSVFNRRIYLKNNPGLVIVKKKYNFQYLFFSVRYFRICTMSYTIVAL